jgi:hypothetical protein
MSFAMMVVAGFGVALLATGLYYQLRKQQLKSDPLLITTCYMWGVLNIAACLISQAPSATNELPQIVEASTVPIVLAQHQ